MAGRSGRRGAPWRGLRRNERLGGLTGAERSGSMWGDAPTKGNTWGDDPTEGNRLGRLMADDRAQKAKVPPAWLRRLVTEEGEPLPVQDLTNRSRRTRAVGQLLEPATRRLLGRRGLAMAPILTHWDAIVGPALARHCIPLRLVMPREKQQGTAPAKGGTLHVKATAGAFATEITHRAPVLCERINMHVGFRAVESIRVTQGPLSRTAADAAARRAGRKASALPPPPLPAQTVRALEDKLAGVTDPELRAVLERLGRAVLGARSRR